MPYQLIAEPAAKYFENTEVHLFWVCTSKETEKRTQWIVEREPGGYATVWPSRRAFQEKDGTPVDPNTIRNPKELTNLAYAGTTAAEVEQCYTPEQALCDGLGLDPDLFYIERAGYYPNVRQLRVKLHDGSATELDLANNAKSARALILKTVRSKATPKYLTLEEMRSGTDDSRLPSFEMASFGNLSWIGDPFDSVRYKAGRSEENYYECDDDEY